MAVLGHYLDHLNVLLLLDLSANSKVFADVLLKTIISNLKIYSEMFLV